MFRNVKGIVSTLYAIMFRKVKGPLIWLLLGMLPSVLFQTYRVYDPVLKFHFSNFVSLGDGLFNGSVQTIAPIFLEELMDQGKWLRLCFCLMTPVLWKNLWIRANDYPTRFNPFSTNEFQLCYLLSQYFNHDAMAMEKDIKKRSVEQLKGTCCHG